MHDKLVYTLAYHLRGKAECIMYLVCSVHLLIQAVTRPPKKKKNSPQRRAVKAKLFARSLLH